MCGKAFHDPFQSIRHQSDLSDARRFTDALGRCPNALDKRTAATGFRFSMQRWMFRI